MLHRFLRYSVFGVLALLLCGCQQTSSFSRFTLPEEGELSLVVNITDIVCCEGVLRLAVYNHKDYWLSETDMVRGRLGFILNDTQTIEIHGLAPGTYSVAVFQDEDQNNKLNRILGIIPSEPYGFSNNVGRYGPASFEDASFKLNENKTITISLNAF